MRRRAGFIPTVEYVVSSPKERAQIVPSGLGNDEIWRCDYDHISEDPGSHHDPSSLT